MAILVHLVSSIFLVSSVNLMPVSDPFLNGLEQETNLKYRLINRSYVINLAVLYVIILVAYVFRTPLLVIVKSLVYPIVKLLTNK